MGWSSECVGLLSCGRARFLFFLLRGCSNILPCGVLPVPYCYSLLACMCTSVELPFGEAKTELYHTPRLALAPSACIFCDDSIKSGFPLLSIHYPPHLRTCCTYCLVVCVA